MARHRFLANAEPIRRDITTPQAEALEIVIVGPVVGETPEFTVAENEGDPPLVQVNESRPIAPDDLGAMTEGRSHHYNLWARAESGSRRRLSYGQFTLSPSITPV